MEMMKGDFLEEEKKEVPNFTVSELPQQPGLGDAILTDMEEGLKQSPSIPLGPHLPAHGCGSQGRVAGPITKSAENQYPKPHSAAYVDFYQQAFQNLVV
ncbi:Exocyst Complex Component 5 [Manis pentadactyla]|nr:Exocyst Complex Component 5 [Manis pentadactyla]